MDDMNCRTSGLRRLVAGATLFAAALACNIPAAEELAPVLSSHARFSDRLYFGRVHPCGLVSEAQWGAFLAEVVTPRFPEGFTVWVAEGQWRDRSNRAVVREPTFVLELVHARAGHPDPDLQAIVAAYKARYAQQSVLWVRDRVTVID
jgi:hypothetical protein